MIDFSQEFGTTAPNIIRKSLTLANGAYTQVNTGGWTISNPDASTLRLVYAGAGSSWDAGAETGLALVFPAALTTIDEMTRILACYVELNAQADTDGVAVGIGLTNNTATPVGNKWAGRFIERDGDGTLTIKDESDTDDNTQTTGTAFIAGVAMMPVDTRIQLWVYDPSTANNDTSFIINRTSTALRSFEGDTVNLVLFAYAGAAGGTIDISGIGYDLAKLRGGIN